MRPGHTWRIVVVDDELPARRGLVQLLQQDAAHVVVGEFADGPSAIEGIRRLQPDIVVLDVEMPEVDGFEVLAGLEPDVHPAVVFATAHESFAVRAFDIDAADYVLKPFDDVRFAQAMARAKRFAGQSHAVRREQTERLLEWWSAERAEGARALPQPYARRLVVRETARTIVVDVANITWIEGADYCVRVHLGGKGVLHRETLTSLESRLDPCRFFRVHRSALVNLAHVREVRPLAYGDSIAVMSDGARVRVGRGRRALLERALAGDAGG
ncbi:MAG: LytTR family DNA-binding domain-containing protein [Gemmatimonadaceae bacterium]